MNYREVQLILDQLKFKPKKSLGQNFLIDKNVLDKIVAESNISSDDIILEVGSGLGALTTRLIERAKKTYAIEIDPILCKYLEEKFSAYKNIEIINRDILKADLPFHNKVVANIPYTITGPILEKVFFKSDPPEGIMIIEKKISKRIFFKGDYKNFSRITIGVNSFMKPIFMRDISSHCFYPVPKIKLSLIKIIPKEHISKFLLEESKRNFFLRLIAGIMPFKNKNISNALELFFRNNKIRNFEKEKIIGLLDEINLNDDKVFSFEVDQLIQISKLIFNLLSKETRCV
jgi:16S rRNA (adenine1518-N6/adenine1519-N6)-dimethyltransferase